MFKWIAYVFKSIFGTTNWPMKKTHLPAKKPTAVSSIVPMEYSAANIWSPGPIPVYCFIFDPKKKKYYGIRHFQGWERVGWKRIPLSELGPLKEFQYNSMGMKIQKYAVEYKPGDPTRIVFGYAYNSILGKVMAMTWNDKKGKIEPVDAETMIDVHDPMKHIQRNT